MSPAKKSGYYRAKHVLAFTYVGPKIPGVVSKGDQITLGPTDGPIPGNSPLFKQFSAEAMAEHFEAITSFGRWDVEAATAVPGEKRGE